MFREAINLTGRTMRSRQRSHHNARNQLGESSPSHRWKYNHVYGLQTNQKSKSKSIFKDETSRWHKVLIIGDEFR